VSTDPQRWTLTFVPAPGWDAPAEIRVRRLLKHALRTLGLRCVAVAPGCPVEASGGTEVAEHPAPGPGAPPGQPEASRRVCP
jgi:hypothetical protein